MGKDLGDFVSSELFHITLASPRVLGAWERAGITGWRSLAAEVRLKRRSPITDYRVLVITGRCEAVDHRKNPNRRLVRSWVRGTGLLIDEASLTDDIVLPKNTAHVIVRPRVIETLTDIGATNWSAKPISEVGWDERPEYFDIEK